MRFRFALRMLIGAIAPLCIASLPHAASAAGAIVLAGNGHSLAWTTHSPTPDIALGHAMDRCLSQYGPGCRVMKTYSNGCMAIAISSDGTSHWGWAVGRDPDQVRMIAVGRCARTGNSCALRDSVCE